MADQAPVLTAGAEDEAEPAERRMFQMTDLVSNHNKFYLVEVWPLQGEQVRFRVTWGRVGSKPQVKEKVASRYEVDRQVLEKVRKGYKRVDLHKPEVVLIQKEEEKPAPPLDPRVAQLIEWVFTEAGEHIQSFLAVEVEALSQAQIAAGRKLLADAHRQHAAYRINPFRREQNFAALAATVQAYYNAIPTKLPARVDREQVVLDFCKQFSEQEDRLLQLEAAVATMKVQRQHPGFDHYQALGAEIKPLPSDDNVYKSLRKYVENTQVHGYKIKVGDVFEVCVPEERRAYEQNTKGTSHRELLFHGTRNQNVRHILRQGLICPQSASNGRMLGNGIYLANKASKSANYCSTRRSGVPHMLLVVEAALGNRYVAPEAAAFSSPPIGFDSVWGRAGHTKVGGTYTLMNDEFVVYSPAQQTIRYLVTFDR
ncbi:MAG TPA: WGR domain-containing protein [Chloroflexia bacterium]|nr:WGR domain-containing protein [Chloroflexia bacterium]